MVDYNRGVWFGTRGNMQWVPAPAINVDATRSGYEQSANFMSGGAWVRRSTTSAKRYGMSWNLMSREEIQPVLDYADRMYGPGYIYYVDPFAMDRNVFPAYWAAPYMNCYDGPAIIDGVRPELVNNSVSENGFPVESALYTVKSTSRIPSIYLPIPEGHTLHMGAFGSVQSGNASVRVTPWTSAIASGTPVNMTLLSKASGIRTNRSWSYANGIVGVSVSMFSTSTGALQLNGMIAQVLPDGAEVTPGGFISGQGSSGMSFASQPSLSQYSAAMDRVGVSAELIETEAWAW